MGVEDTRSVLLKKALRSASERTSAAEYWKGEKNSGLEGVPPEGVFIVAQMQTTGIRTEICGAFITIVGAHSSRRTLSGFVGGVDLRPVLTVESRDLRSTLYRSRRRPGSGPQPPIDLPQTDMQCTADHSAQQQ